ncbi:universal stress protein [Streptomyces sp. NPDC006365]|uniref:universal stress protein n=1 Tax=Streptomyces sp. NPDC006365 TaxID=3364744 RepID=UPI00368F352F
MTELTAGHDIVVGVDGSKASIAALRWAAQQARALRAEVVAVHAWEPSVYGIAPYASVSARPSAAEERDQAAELLAATVRAVFGPRIDGSVRAVLAEGPPARVLLQHTRGALLLALGRKAHGERGLPPIGTVGRECLRHATIPVVAVPAPDRPAGQLRAVETPPPARSGAA